jgi:hypothetical protein
MTDDDRIDFSAFDGVPLEALARDIATRCAPLFAGPRRPRTSTQIVTWWRPTLAAALVVGVVSSVFLSRPRRTQVEGTAVAAAPPAPLPPPPAPTQVAQALGMPEPIVRRLSRPSPPTIDDLLQEVAR